MTGTANELKIPTDWSQVTPEWMTAALSPRLPGVRVGGVRLVSHDEGSNMRARFALTYAEGEGPASLFLKQHAPVNREAHVANGNLYVEAQLYDSGVPLGVDFPKVYRVVIDRDDLNFLVVMEDLNARGADPRDATRPMTAAQVKSGVEGLARMHSLYWGFDGTIQPKLDWVRSWSKVTGFEGGFRINIPRGLERAAGTLPDALADWSVEALIALWGRYVATLGEGTPTLLHADAHIGNSYVLPGDTVGFFDPIARRGNWAQDTGYFLVSALTPDDRRRSDADLIDAYRNALTLPEDQAPSREDMWLQYRASPIYGLCVWLATLGADGWQRNEICLPLAQRYAAAFVEHDSPAAIAEIEARIAAKTY